ncbi:MAG: carboxypeptidase-like regulatory domain-containing protein, partial [Chloroflexota bacterium]
MTVDTVSYQGMPVPAIVQVPVTAGGIGTTDEPVVLVLTRLGTSPSLLTVDITNGPPSAAVEVMAVGHAGFVRSSATLNGSGAGSVAMTLSAGDYQVSVTNPSTGPQLFMATPPELITLSSSENATLTINLGAFKIVRPLAVRVVDQNGSGMANAPVWAHRPISSGFIAGSEAAGTTNGNGDVTLQVTAGVYSVGAALAGVPAPPEQAVEVTDSGQSPNPVLLTVNTGVQFAVVATNCLAECQTPTPSIGGSIAGAYVRAERTDGPGFADGLTNQQGRADFSLTPGTWNFQLHSMLGGLVSRPGIAVQSGGALEIVVDSSRMVDLFAKVGLGSCANLTPVQFASIGIQPHPTASRPGVGYYTALTNANGLAFVGNIPVQPGDAVTYRMHADIPNGGGPEVVDFTIDSTGTIQVNGVGTAAGTQDNPLCVAQTPQTIRFELTAEVESFYAAALSADGRENSASFYPEPGETLVGGGELVVPGAGTYSVGLRIPGHTPVLVQVAVGPCTATPGVTCDGAVAVASVPVAANESRTVAGVVRDAEEGNRVLGDAVVTAYAVDGSFTESTRSNPNGSYLLTVPGKPVQIGVQRKGYLPPQLLA